MRAASLRRLGWGVLWLTCVSVAGCFGTPNLYAPNRTVQAPPLRWDGQGGVVEVTMRAPNPGWRLEYDTVKASRDGPRLLFTVYRPDPGMIFPQQVVDKAVRTDQPPTPGTRVWVRALEHGGEGGRYSPTDLVVPTAPEPDAEPDAEPEP